MVSCLIYVLLVLFSDSDVLPPNRNVSVMVLGKNMSRPKQHFCHSTFNQNTLQVWPGRCARMRIAAPLYARQWRMHNGEIQLRDLEQTGGGGGTCVFKGLRCTFYTRSDSE